MTALKTEPITTGTTKKLSGNGRRGDLDGEGASILSTTPEWAFRGCGGRTGAPARPTVNSAASLAVPKCPLRLSWLLQKLRQLRNVHRKPPRLIFGEQFGRRPPPRLILEID